MTVSRVGVMIVAVALWTGACAPSSEPAPESDITAAPEVALDEQPPVEPDTADVQVVDTAAPPVEPPDQAAEPLGQPSLPVAPVPAAGEPQSPAERTWRDVTESDITVNLVFVDLPPDHGVVTPIDSTYRASRDAECIRASLDTWPPAQVEDPVQRTRNVLMVAGAADLLQMPVERSAPLVVFAHLEQTLQREDLIKILYWIAVKPFEGSVSALDALPGACLDVYPPDDIGELQHRVGLYATKLLGRLTGRLSFPGV